MAIKNQKAYLPLRDRLILNFVTFGVVIIIIIGAFSYYTAREILLERTFDQLISLRVVKKRQIESFFADRSRDVRLIVSSREAHELLRLIGGNDNSQTSSSEEALRIYESYLARYLASQDYYRSFYIVAKSGKALRITTGDNKYRSGEKVEFYDNNILPKMWEAIQTGVEWHIIDLDKNKPEPGLFIGGPLKEDGRITGMVALEISIGAINKIMYENNPYEGLGESGESYLVGRDLLMRSNSRFQDNSILNTRVASIGVKKALQGIDSTAVIADYRGIPVLSAFGPVEISGLHWVVLTEIDKKEALVPLNAIRNNILLISSFIVLFLFLTAVFLSHRITYPVIQLKKAAEKVGQGRFDTVLKLKPNNEIGDLTESFNEMTENLAEKTSQLRLERIKRLRSVIDGQELERQRLSRELHDGLGQLLIALKLKMENLDPSDPSGASPAVGEVKSSLNDTIDEVKRMSHNLMPAVLYEFGISTALRNLVDEIADNAGLQTTFQSKGKFDDLEKGIKTYLYRIAQEALNNVVQHAGATRARVSLTNIDHSVEMRIEDNGKGFIENEKNGQPGNGLHNMKERTTLLGGSFKIDKLVPKGTVIIVNIPAKNNKA